MLKLIYKIVLVFTFFSHFIQSQELHLNLIGTLCSSAQTKLGSQISGRVEEVYVEIGDSITKGQSLLKLDTSILEIDVLQKQALLQSAKIEFKDAEANFNRMKYLWEKPEGESPTISQKRFEDAKLRYDQSKVQVIQAQQNFNRTKFNLDEAIIKASFDGVVTHRYVDPGEVVTSTPVAHVLQIQAIDPLYLEFSISQMHLNQVKVGDPLTFRVEGSDSENLSAQIDRIYPIIDEHTRTIKCRAIIDNKTKNLLPGSLVKVEINTL